MSEIKRIPQVPLMEVDVAIVGAGPSGLIAADILSDLGIKVDIFEKMTSPGRKLLIAGKGGLNITHSEPLDIFISRFGTKASLLAPFLQKFGPNEVTSWAKKHEVDTFVGTSGRVFPTGMKAATLLFNIKSSLHRKGVMFHYQHHWQGFSPKGKGLVFHSLDGEITVNSKACLFALGGASWGFTGSTGDWVDAFSKAGILVTPFKPANCGFGVRFSEHIKNKFDGTPLKTVSIEVTDNTGRVHKKQGEFILTKNGIEGSLVYALSAPIRDSFLAGEQATIYLDLLPDTPLEQIEAKLSQPRKKQSLSTYLQKTTGIAGAKTALLYEFTPKESLSTPALLAHALKHLPIPISSIEPLDRAISTAGGVKFEQLDNDLMIKKMPAVFVAGEMLDWEAPTGGYLLTACLSTGVAAAEGIAKYLR